MKIADMWNSNFLVVDAAIAAAFSGGLVIWTFWFGGYDHLNELMHGNRTTIYRTTFSAAATLLGFSLAAVSIVFGLSSNKRLRLLSRNPLYPRLWRTLFQTTWLLGTLTVISLAGLIIDTDRSPVPPFVVLTASVLVMAAFRLGRSIWIVEQLILVVIATYQRS